MNSRMCMLVILLAIFAFGCHTSTQPRTADSFSTNIPDIPLGILSLRTDSLQYHRSAGWSQVTMFIRNRADSAVVFPACGSVSVRIDTSLDQGWIVGKPQWQQICLGMYAVSIVVMPDSVCSTNLPMQNIGTYRVVTIYCGVSQGGRYSDTLISNSFTVLQEASCRLTILKRKQSSR